MDRAPGGRSRPGWSPARWAGTRWRSRDRSSSCPSSTPELAILRQATPALASEAFVPAGVETLDCALAFRSADAPWLRGFLAREDVRSALGKLRARAEADTSFGVVRAGRGVGEIALRRLVGRRSGLFYFRDPEGGPFDAADVRDLVQILAPLKHALS